MFTGSAHRYEKFYTFKSIFFPFCCACRDSATRKQYLFDFIINANTHTFTFSQGFSEIGTGETVAVLLNQECGGSKSQITVKNIGYIPNQYHLPKATHKLKTTDFVYLISL